MDMRSAIEGRLKTLNPQIFEFQDDSHLHKGHAGNKGGGHHAGNKGGGHYAVTVVSEAFTGMKRIERQRMVQNLLQDLFAGGFIHALSIKAATPDEYFH